MEGRNSRKESLNFRDIFMRRRSSCDEIQSAENSRKNSLVTSDSLKNLVSLMVGSKGTSSHADPLFNKLQLPIGDADKPKIQ